MYIVIRESLVWTNISYGHKQFSACCVVTVYTVNEVMVTALVMSLNTSRSRVQGQLAKSRIIFQAVVSLVTQNMELYAQKKGTVQVWFTSVCNLSNGKVDEDNARNTCSFHPRYPPVNPSPPQDY